MNKSVAIIGSGPSGLTCAAFLAMMGVNVTIYEKNSELGGLLVYGIPDFRLDREVVRKTISKILELGINVKTNCELGRDFELQDISKKYDAIYLAIGANEPNYVLNGKKIISANLLLEKLNKKTEIPDFQGKNVAVSGGGNVAMDVSRTLKRLGANVTIIYRRQEEQMPAEKEEIEIAKKEGINFLLTTNILAVDDDGKTKCIKTKLVKKEGIDRPVPVNIDGSEFELVFDYVVLAVGAKTNANLIKKQGLNIDNKGYTIVNNRFQTSLKNVYAGGDVCGSEAKVAVSARNGRDAAKYIFEDIIKM